MLTFLQTIKESKAIIEVAQVQELIMKLKALKMKTIMVLSPKMTGSTWTLKIRKY